MIRRARVQKPTIWITEPAQHKNEAMESILDDLAIVGGVGGHSIHVVVRCHPVTRTYGGSGRIVCVRVITFSAELAHL